MQRSGAHVGPNPWITADSTFPVWVGRFTDCREGSLNMRRHSFAELLGAAST